MSFLEPRPAITVTDTDYERLIVLADQIRPRQPAVAAMLTAELDRAALVAPERIAADVATMRSHVVFGYEHTGRPHWLTIVYPGEADLDRAFVSVATPVGAALLGLKEGQSIAWSTASGERRAIQLHKVVYQPERAGRYDL
ncbi:MAG TPA: nucleoside diphosphate kinase regulator [Ferrovibrio sp.]|uniref:nucleoside diphosphate kinase regulator n=1 Tax=Ferrovibrio sp. TaxID=1917215 RepID=UPI002ED578ED